MLEFSEWFSFELCQIFGLAVMSGCVVIAVFWCADQVYRRLRISFLILQWCRENKGRLKKTHWWVCDESDLPDDGTD